MNVIIPLNIIQRTILIQKSSVSNYIHNNTNLDGQAELTHNNRSKQTVYVKLTRVTPTTSKTRYYIPWK